MKWSFRTVLLRGVCFLVLWWVVSEGQWGEWPLLVASIVAATAASLFLWPAGTWQWRPLPLLRFLPWFLRASLRGGVDVARRACRRRVPLDPAFINMELQLSTESAQVFFAWTVSLLPGTASVGLEGNRLTVHVLDRGMPNEQSLHALEQRAAALFR
jgi:multicomponent Na+:H+ antiporter subunit E